MTALTHYNTFYAMVSQAKAVPVLTLEEEMELAHKSKLNCKKSIQRLAQAHFRYVISIARAFSAYGVDVEDLVQQGCIGLMRAIKDFCPREHKGVRLATFATIRIKGEIVEFVLNNVRSYRIATTKAQKKLFFNLGKYWNGDSSRRSLSQAEVKMIADDLNVSVADVRAMEMKLRGADAPILNEEEEENHPGLVHYADEDADPARVIDAVEESQLLKHINEAISSLPERDQQVIYWRLVSEEKKELRVMAEEFGVSNERIRQIEKKALAKVQQLVEHLR